MGATRPRRELAAGVARAGWDDGSWEWLFPLRHPRAVPLAEVHPVEGAGLRVDDATDGGAELHDQSEPTACDERRTAVGELVGGRS